MRVSFCFELSAVMARNPVFLLAKKKLNGSRVYFSDRCCAQEIFCGIHLTNFLAFCYSIYYKKKSDLKGAVSRQSSSFCLVFPITRP